METQLTTQSVQPISAKALFSQDNVKAKFQELLGKRAAAFITSVLQVVASNQDLKNADANSIYQAAAVAATLDLPLNNNLGFAYIIAYNTKQKDGSYKMVAKFQMGYKGFIQLAQRSGQFKTISSAAIYEGELIEQNPLTGFVFDFTKRTSNTVIGYAGYFELLNGFQKTLFMSLDQIKQHGANYSKTYNSKSGIWEKDFNSMATKTVLKLLLSKFAPLSIEMQRAVVLDQSMIINADTDEVTYIDRGQPQIDKEEDRIQQMIETSTTLEELVVVNGKVPDALLDLYTAKYDELERK